MAIAEIHYEILDKCAPPQVRQQILGIVLCLEIPLFPFTMLVTELTHKLLYPQQSIRTLRRSLCARGGLDFDLPLEGTLKLTPVFPVSALHAAINYNVYENMNRRISK